MQDFNFFWSKGNEKLNKTAKVWEKQFGTKARFIGFNIPRLMSASGQTTCPYAGICKEYCYADQGRMAMPLSQKARERNLDSINRMGWGEICDGLVEDLNRMRSITHVRIHDSGDFFSRKYYQTWILVAQQLPDLLFYAYTKSLPLIDWNSHPDNFRITQSVGGKRDHDIDETRPHAKVFVSHDDREHAGYCDGNASDLPAILGQTRIGLVYHGTRLLDEDSRRHLEVVA